MKNTKRENSLKRQKEKEEEEERRIISIEAMSDHYILE